MADQLEAAAALRSRCVVYYRFAWLRFTTKGLLILQWTGRRVILELLLLSLLLLLPFANKKRKRSS